MNNINPLLFGIIVLVIVCLLKDSIPYIGRLPGDVEFFYGRNFHLYFPFTSALLVSLALFFVLRLFTYPELHSRIWFFQLSFFLGPITPSSHSFQCNYNLRTQNHVPSLSRCGTLYNQALPPTIFTSHVELAQRQAVRDYSDFQKYQCRRNIPRKTHYEKWPWEQRLLN